MFRTYVIYLLLCIQY